MDRLAFLDDPRPLPLAAARARAEELGPLRHHLAELGYTEPGVVAALRLSTLHERRSGWLPIWTRWFLRADDPGHALIRLFHLGLPEPEASLLRGLGQQTLTTLRDLGLLQRSGAQELRATVALTPIGDLLVATDLPVEEQTAAQRHPARVMYLGGDSCGLARLVSNVTAPRALDLCTGSGVQALHAARRGAQVVGVDINPRAVHFARFNAVLNGLDQVCRFEQGDLWAPLGDERFELITANPPFVPSPALDELLFRDGGVGGEEVLARILSGCADHLTRPGTLLVTTNLVHHRGRPYEGKLHGWLADLGSYGALAMEDEGFDPYEYALGHLQAYADDPDWEQRLHAWIGQYQAEGIERVCNGYICVRTASAGPARVLRLPMQGEFHRALPAGWMERSFERLLRPPDAGLPRRFTLVAELDDVRLTGLEAPIEGLSLAFPLARCLADAGPAGTSLDELWLALRGQGHELDAEQEADIQECLGQLHVAGLLAAAGA